MKGIKEEQHFNSTPESAVSTRVVFSNVGGQEEPVVLEENPGALLYASGTTETIEEGQEAIAPRILIFGTPSEITSLLAGLYVSMVATYGEGVAANMLQVAGYQAMLQTGMIVPGDEIPVTSVPSFN